MKKSTTPIADKNAAEYAASYRTHPHFHVSRDRFYLKRCYKCDGKLSFLMSAYAFHQGPADNAMICPSGHVQWLHITTLEKE